MGVEGWCGIFVYIPWGTRPSSNWLGDVFAYVYLDVGVICSMFCNK